MWSVFVSSCQQRPLCPDTQADIKDTHNKDKTLIAFGLLFNCWSYELFVNPIDLLLSFLETKDLFMISRSCFMLHYALIARGLGRMRIKSVCVDAFFRCCFDWQWGPLLLYLGIKAFLLFKSNLLMVCVPECVCLNQLLACVFLYVCLGGREEITHWGGPNLQISSWVLHSGGIINNSEHRQRPSLRLFGHKSAAGQPASMCTLNSLSCEEFSRVCVCVSWCTCVCFVLYSNARGQSPDPTPTVTTCTH